MALGLLYTCRCGRRYKAYVPKQKLFRGLTGKHVDWSVVDATDEASGDVDEVMAMAAATGAVFVDLRHDGGKVTCDVCQSEVDLLAHFTAVLTHSNYLATSSIAGFKERRLRA